ncbi:DUF1223 domain-containing protein [Pelagibacterium luteolum]|uniref:DUF1223 domain-containing protein n=1 Tax=Pelagibacterium luteolum TaxID=440168 RepID=A0A1G7SGH8_9HYPH|nr:DUF1223 domain-containing protein [Pelagibacterium luteolum]SDG21529.1 hypothetical protein SAMN04487974_101471 [Pelagibacterium luteolum]
MMFARLLSAWLAPLVMFGFVVAPAGAIDIRSNADTVVELFTSQGCSRCPDADRLLAELGERDDIVALAYHIDYWDYIGWQDTFALPGNTELQKGYAQAWGKNRIYTPQMVINGAHAVVGSDAREAENAISAARTPLEISLVAADADSVTVSAPANGTHQASVVWLVTYRALAEVVVERGENSGRVLPYTHIVTGRQAIGMWDPQSGANLTIPLAEVLGTHSDGAAVIIQEKHGNLPGAIIAASAFDR